MTDLQLKSEIHQRLGEVNIFLMELARRGVTVDLTVNDVSELGMPAPAYRVDCLRLYRRKDEEV